jgi:hypothetical protein
MSLIDRFKKAVKARRATKASKEAVAKKERLRAGRLKATGQTVESATKIQNRIDARSSATGAVAKRDAERGAKRKVEEIKRKKAQDISRYGTTSSTKIRGEKLLEQLTAKQKKKKKKEADG